MRSLTACFVFLLLGLSACSMEAPRQSTAASPVVAESPSAPPSGDRAGIGRGNAQAGAPAGKVESSSDLLLPVALQTAGAAQAAAEAFDRKIIRNADLTVEVEGPEDAQRRISSIAEANGGFVVTSESQQRGDAGMFVTITMRVPAAQFGGAVDAIRKIGGRILQDKVSGQDVTEEFIDLEARIRTKKALETQFLEIMKQTRSINEALEVQRQIAGVRTEIEQLEGRRRFLDNQSSLSTIIVKLQPPTPIMPAGTNSFVSDLKRSLADSGDTAIAIVLGFIRALGFLIPVALLIGLPLYLLIRFLIRRFGPAFRPAQPAPPQ
jgi:hypothetical protein